MSQLEDVGARKTSGRSGPSGTSEKEREWLNLLHAGQTTLEEAWLCLAVPSCERKGCVLNGIAKIVGCGGRGGRGCRN